MYFTCCLLFATTALSETYSVTTTEELNIMLKQAQNGDVIDLKSAIYTGNFIIERPITLKSSQDAIIDAAGEGNAISITSSSVRIKGLTITNWGSDLTAQNAGIYSDKKANDLIIEHNKLQGRGFGMWLQNISKSRIANNVVNGDVSMRSADRGNGIQLSNVQSTDVVDNIVTETRDGVYVINSTNNLIKGNKMSNLRYGIHYMYSYDNTVVNNTADTTRAGYALMSSKGLLVENNKTTNSEDYGFLLNFITQSTINHNYISNVWTKPENQVMGRQGKGIFVYNSGYNSISNNHIEKAEIGIHLTAGSEQVKVFGNSFINNPTQVKYVSNAFQEWSVDGKGNYWSNYLGWDLDNNGYGDVPFEPNDGIDTLIWKYPEMKVLMNSPAVLVLRWVQKQFPVLKPPGVKDSHPIMLTSAHKLTDKEYAQND